MSLPPARSWTPQQLARALLGRRGALSRRTIARACASGDIPHTRTPGGHVRIDPAYVEKIWPGLTADADAADAPT